jgi:hypothetical protein
MSVLLGLLPILAALIPFCISQYTKHESSKLTPQGKHEANEKLILGSDIALSNAIDAKLRNKGITK